MCPPPLRRLPNGLRDGQEPPCAELRDEVRRVPEGPLPVHVELFTDPGDDGARRRLAVRRFPDQRPDRVQGVQRAAIRAEDDGLAVVDPRSEEHTSELQSLAYLVCRLLLEKKKKKANHRSHNTISTRPQQD